MERLKRLNAYDWGYLVTVPCFWACIPIMNYPWGGAACGASMVLLVFFWIMGIKLRNKQKKNDKNDNDQNRTFHRNDIFRKWWRD